MNRVLEIINAIAFSQIIFFTLYLFYMGNKVHTSWFLKAFLISQLAAYIDFFLYKSGIPLGSLLYGLFQPIRFLWGPLFYLYVRSSLFKNVKPYSAFFPHGLPAIAWAVVMIVWYFYNPFSSFLDYQKRAITQSILFHIQILIYNIATLILIERYRLSAEEVTSGDQQPKLQWIKIISYSFLIMTSVNFIVVFVPEIRHLRLGYYFFFLFLNVLFFKAIINPVHYLCLDEKKIVLENYSEKTLENFQRLEKTMQQEKLYLDPELNLAFLAKKAGLPERSVSLAIHHQSGGNFADYVNRYRVDYAKKILNDPSQSKKTILEILYESGYNSKSVFNHQFKKITGIAPKEYRNKNKINCTDKKSN